MPRIRFICIALLAALLAACGGAGAPATTIRQQAVDGLTIALEEPSGPVVLDQATFTVTLTDAGGKPVDGADVYLDMSMAAMKMGTNKPVASPAGNGVYRALGTFDMAGDWTITVHAAVGGKDHAATFDSKVAEK
jgi:nitrogen fixation protein FixH